MFSGRLVAAVWRPVCRHQFVIADRLAANVGQFKCHSTATARYAASNAIQKHISALRYHTNFYGFCQIQGILIVFSWHVFGETPSETDFGLKSVSAVTGNSEFFFV
jgi:hypothetical protein